MAALEALLTRLPDTVLQEFRDAAILHRQLPDEKCRVGVNDLSAWLGQRGDVDFSSQSRQLEQFFDPRSMYGADKCLFKTSHWMAIPPSLSTKPGPPRRPQIIVTLTTIINSQTTRFPTHYIDASGAFTPVFWAESLR
ncbi:hypothetical protein B0H16DRAFT_1890141 [Mycena metata]|uniref:Uncharacterized protein n=1 Tax=Mycena metata TaxID=1033252 RepID=A0AAD7N2M7_9AGAR|nr:hypothetical protein B0H16DRAFT_1890141 [Mycena metata]